MSCHIAVCTNPRTNELTCPQQMYSAIDKHADSYSQLLCKEAVRLWSIEKHTDSIINMVGAQMLSIAYMWNGKNHEVLVYQAEAIRMGTRLGLLGVDEKTAAILLAKIPPELLHASAFAAWGVFNWAMSVQLCTVSGERN